MELDADPNPVNFDLRRRIAFYAAGITLLTLIINGSIVKPIYQSLKIYAHPEEAVTDLSICLRKCNDEVDEL